MRILFLLSLFTSTACCHGVDARSTYNAATHIADSAAAGKAAFAQCKQGGDAAATFCPKVDEAFDDISNAAKPLADNAKAAGGDK